MAGENKPVDIGVFNQLNVPQFLSTDEERFVSRIPLINWTAIPFSSFEVQVAESNARIVKITKICKIDAMGNIT